MSKPKKVLCKHCKVEMEQVKPRYIITFRNSIIRIGILSLITIILAIMNKGGMLYSCNNKCYIHISLYM